MKAFLSCFVAVVLTLLCLGAVNTLQAQQADVVDSIDDFRSPVAVDHRINQFPGTSHSPKYSIDIGAVPQGSWDGPIFAAASGVITKAQWDGDGYGNFILIDHGNHWVSRYAHLSGFAPVTRTLRGNDVFYETDSTKTVFVVTVGQYVEKGQLIGFLGSTGRSDGTHLHFEVYNTLKTEDQRIADMNSLSWVNYKAQQFHIGVTGQPVPNPPCSLRTYAGIDFFTGKYCQTSSPWFSNTPGTYSITAPEVASIYVAPGWSVYLRSRSLSTFACANRSLWDVSKDKFDDGSLIVNNIGEATVYQNSTCNGMRDPYDPALENGTGSSGTGAPGTGGTLPDPYPSSCTNIGNFDKTRAYFFDQANCLGEISWFSGHDANGPSASGQSSLFVPANAVVTVSSNDNGGGDKQCFASIVTDLSVVGWQNRIQWAQLVTGGTCQSTAPTAASYRIHTNQGDFTVSVGQVWDNLQFNRQILGFDKQGDANLVITHKGGATRCWNESKTAASLGLDGDWWLQTAKITVGSGYCPGNNGELVVYGSSNFLGTEIAHIHAGNTQTFPDNQLKNSFRFSEAGMSAVFKNGDNRERCFNTNVNGLQDHEDYWNRTVEIKVYGTNVCPPPVPTPTPRPPEPPTNLTAVVNGADEVTLNWTNDYGYNGGTVIWEKHPGQSTYVGSLSVGEGGTSFKYFVASCGQAVEYYVEAVASDGRKAQSNHAFATTNSCSNLVAPTNFRAHPIDYDSVRLDWDNNQSGVWEGYLVSYQKQDGSWVEIWPAGRYQNYFDINGLTPCYAPWTMAVVSYQNATRSPKSLPVTFTLPGCPTAAPQNFTVTVGSNNVAQLNWTAQPFATGYNIDYSYNGSAFGPFSMGVTTSYPWSGFGCGATVTLRLSANTPYGRSAYAEVTFQGVSCLGAANVTESLTNLETPSPDTVITQENGVFTNSIFLPIVSK